MFFTLDVLPEGVLVFLLAARAQVTLGIFNLKLGLLLDGRGQRICVHPHQTRTQSLLNVRPVKTSYQRICDQRRYICAQSENDHYFR